jgi:integrase
MPIEQTGSIYKTGSGYGIRFWRNNKRVRQTGFSSRSAARRWLRDVELPRQRGETIEEKVTFAEFVDRYLVRYGTLRTPRTVETLRGRLRRPLAAFGDVPLVELRTADVAAFEATLPPRYRHAVMRSMRQVLAAAVDWQHLTRNPAVTGPNPQPPIIERGVLEPDYVEALAEAIAFPYDVMVIVAAWCYLRPSEAVQLERRDVGDGVVHVRGVKTRRSDRHVPLPGRAREALDRLPTRIDSRLIFPAARGGVIDLHNWSARHFKPAARLIGLDATPYSLRHSGISWALAAGVPPTDVARFAGTSITMLERHYAHQLTDSLENARLRLDAFRQSGHYLATSR